MLILITTITVVNTRHNFQEKRRRRKQRRVNLAIQKCKNSEPLEDLEIQKEKSTRMTDIFLEILESVNKV